MVVSATLVHNQFTAPWKQEELEYLRENYLKLDKETVLANLDRSWRAIQNKSNKIGITRHESYPYSYFSEQEIQTIKEFYPRAPKEAILKLIPRSWSAILEQAFRLGISRDAPMRIFKPEVFNLSQVEWGYIAGIIDGEGSITDFHTHRGSVYSPRVYISNTDMNLMHWLVAKLGGTVRENGNFKSGGIHKKHCYVWQIHRYGAVYSILSALLPYLIIKRKKALVSLNKLREHIEVPEGGVLFLS